MAKLDEVMVMAVYRRGPIAALILKIQSLLQALHDYRVSGFRWVGEDDPKGIEVNVFFHDLARGNIDLLAAGHRHYAVIARRLATY